MKFFAEQLHFQSPALSPKPPDATMVLLAHRVQDDLLRIDQLHQTGVRFLLGAVSSIIPAFEPTDEKATKIKQLCDT